jgi:hypothetical protein
MPCIKARVNRLPAKGHRVDILGEACGQSPTPLTLPPPLAPAKRMRLRWRGRVRGVASFRVVAKLCERGNPKGGMEFSAPLLRKLGRPAVNGVRR